ncbi:hypothetical protein [Nocardia blacklockiae]|uniref:hypothetical protein n=1 Tax=Nocardia blacklockiae TaxID=480036 RepID=UPI0018930937|nr:hypothetical protein [Nocardia blacklockiae]MBF6171560.1 hypothetical protein [Nocardia blacklockiae]
MTINAIEPEVLRRILSEFGVSGESATTLLTLDDGDHHHDPAWRVDGGGGRMVLRLVAEGNGRGWGISGTAMRC